MILLVDDVRDIPGVDLIARNYNTAFKAILYFRPDTLFLDHDLGEGKTGYDLINSLIDMGDGLYLPKKIAIVSSNPVGVQNIERALMNMHYIKKPPNIYER